MADKDKKKQAEKPPETPETATNEAAVPEPPADDAPVLYKSPGYEYFGSTVILHNEKTGEDLVEHTFVADIPRAGVLVRNIHTLDKHDDSPNVVLGVTVTHIPNSGIRTDKKRGIKSICASIV